MVREAHHPLTRNDEMIPEVDIELGQQDSKTLGEAQVGTTGLGHPGGVIVKNDDLCRVKLKGACNELPWIDAGLREGASKNLLGSDQAPLGIEKRRTEDLMRQPREMHSQPGTQVERALEGLPGFWALGDPAHGLCRRLNEGKFGRTDPSQFPNLRERCGDDGRE